LPASQLSFLHFEKAMNALPARLTLNHIVLHYKESNSDRRKVRCY